jgi:hypothetical protein
MNKQLSADELSVLLVPVMTRREKLLRFARIVRAHPGNLHLFSNIEYMDRRALAAERHPFSMFAAAAHDPVLADAGLHGDSVIEAMRFFELTKDELHYFSCDCGGAISNEEMARRIDSLAACSQ